PICLTLVRSMILTWGPPPGPAPVTISAFPSPVKSAAATHTPPTNPGANAKKLASSAPDTPSNTLTCGPPPAQALVTMSSTPSPVTSAVATRMPLVNPGSYAWMLNLSVPSGLNALKLGGPPGPAATAYSSSVTRRAFENSDVSPLFKFVAVAVTNFPARLPAATATGVNT